jgi:hypothetical protein
LLGKAASTCWEVWIGGTPASCNMISSVNLGNASYS